MAGDVAVVCTVMAIPSAHVISARLPHCTTICSSLTDSQIDRQTEGQSGRQTENHTDRQTGSHTDRRAGRWEDRQTDEQLHRQTHTRAHNTDRQTGSHTDIPDDVADTGAASTPGPGRLRLARAACRSCSAAMLRRSDSESGILTTPLEVGSGPPLDRAPLLSMTLGTGDAASSSSGPMPACNWVCALGF